MKNIIKRILNHYGYYNECHFWHHMDMTNKIIKVGNQHRKSLKSHITIFLDGQKILSYVVKNKPATVSANVRLTGKR